MQQQINLLSPGLIPPKAQVTAQQALVGCAALGLLLLAWSAWQGYGLYQDRNALATLNKELATLSAANDKLRQLAQRKANPQLAQRVAAMRERKNEEQQLRHVLVDLERGQGFTRHFSNLALVQVDGLWLDNFEFAGGGRRVTLRGYAHHADKVPEFLQRLAAGNGFAGHTFDEFELTQTKDGILRFAIIGPHATEPA